MRESMSAEAPGATAAPPLTDFVAAYLDAWNSHDADGLLACMTPDVVYDDSAWPETMRGHDDVRRFLEHAWRAFPDMRFEIVEGPYRLGEDKAAFWWRGTGTMTGALDPPRFAPTGRRWRVDGADFHEYRDGLISRLRIVFNLAEASQQLGLMPTPGSRAVRIAPALQRVETRCKRR
jgi:steroid delta-isomerase-like uncharacterized protein